MLPPPPFSAGQHIRHCTDARFERETVVQVCGFEGRYARVQWPATYGAGAGAGAGAGSGSMRAAAPSSYELVAWRDTTPRPPGLRLILDGFVYIVWPDTTPLPPPPPPPPPAAGAGAGAGAGDVKDVKQEKSQAMGGSAAAAMGAAAASASAAAAVPAQSLVAYSYVAVRRLHAPRVGSTFRLRTTAPAPARPNAPKAKAKAAVVYNVCQVWGPLFRAQLGPWYSVDDPKVIF